jgi:hypothetical protein
LSLAVGDTGVRHTGSFRVFPAIWASLLPLSESSTVSNCFDDMLALFPLKETIFCQCRGHNWCGSGPNQDCLSAGITRQAMLRTLDPEMVEEFDYKECVSASSLTPMCRLCKIVMPHQRIMAVPKYRAHILIGRPTLKCSVMDCFSCYQ